MVSGPVSLYDWATRDVRAYSRLIGQRRQALGKLVVSVQKPPGGLVVVEPFGQRDVP